MTKFALCLMVVLSSGSMGFAQTGESTETAVKQLFHDYVLAFNAADFEAMASKWSQNAVYVDHSTGERTVGRDAIISDLKEAIAANASLRLSGSISHLTKLDEDLVSVQGDVSLSMGASPPSLYRFTSIVKRRENVWEWKMVEEFPVLAGSGAAGSLEEIAWLIGTWQTEGDGASVVSTIRPAVGGAFLVRSYESMDEDGALQQSTEIIGVDPRTQSIVLWSFHSDGSFGTGLVEKHDQLWKIESNQTLADGRSANGTFVVERVDSDTLTVQLVGHDIEGEPQPTAAPTTMKRLSQETTTGKDNAEKDAVAKPEP